MRNIRRTLILGSVGAVLMPRIAAGRELASVVLAEEASVQAGVPALSLAGAGVFRFFFLSVYVCGLYLPPRNTWGGQPLREDTARRVSLVMLREVSARLFLWGLDRGLADNTPAAELTALADPIEKLRELIRGIGTLQKGTRVDMDYVPGRGTGLNVGGRARGEPVPGKALNDAVLRVWIGDRPLDASLREVLLGG